jgi:hypothetical protein
MGQSGSAQRTSARRPGDQIAINIPNDSELNPERYTRPLERCFCHGKYYGANAHQHVMFVAFLELDNDEHVQPGSMDDVIIPWNSLAAWMGRTKITHVQPVFVDTDINEFYTVSTDMLRGVHCMSRKTFAARGWRFVTVLVDEVTELRIYNFLIAQHGKPFSRWGIIWLYTRPVDMQGRSWFCSELTLAALRAGGLLTGWHRKSYTVPPHELHEKLTNDPALVNLCIPLSNNPVFAAAVRKASFR